MNASHETKEKAAWWDMVGLVLTLDKRLFVLLPTLAAIGFLGSKLL